MSKASIGVSGAGPRESQTEPVWVLEDSRAGTAAQAIGIAERLGVPFRRLPLSWTVFAHLAALRRGGSLAGVNPAALDLGGAPPRLVISAGNRSIAVALWLQTHLDCRVVHCMRPQLHAALAAAQFDLLVIPHHDRPPLADNVLPVLGAPHRVSPFALLRAQAEWEERLAHLPRPRIALMVGGKVRGTEMDPSLAHALGRQVARLAAAHRGSVMVTTSRRTGAEATEALAAALGPVMHLMFRWGDPGPNPYLGYLALADAIVVTGDSVSMISEACTAAAPVFIALPELAGQRHRRLHRSLYEAGQARPLGSSLSPWPRQGLDEAGRVAAEILRRFPLD
ncbi:MAG TPA: mitochondrial fission ELM1 family protein [Acetobacteraceae bacterium]|nr:mitochondrial fission ELM1 family protein [Acetobacteraceae bacterium]